MPDSDANLLSQLTPLDWGLWALGFGLLVVFMIPPVVTALGLRFVRFRASQEAADVEAVQPDGTNPDYADRFEELRQLGFKPVGTVYEEMWLYLHEYYKCFPVRMLVSSDGLTFAALYTLGWGGPTRVALDSVSEAGLFIQTAMPGAELEVHESDFHRTEMPHAPVAVLLAKHDRQVDRCLQRSRGRLARQSLAERTQRDETISKRMLEGIGQGAVSAYPVIGWFIPFGLALWALTSGLEQSWPRALGLAAVVAGAAYLAFTLMIMPAFHRFMERLEANGECCDR